MASRRAPVRAESPSPSAAAVLTLSGRMGAPFPRWSNTATHVALLAVVGGGVGGLAFLFFLARSPYVNNIADPPFQPFEFDHRHHVRDDGIDCRYCHTTVETQARAGIPPAELCLNCHSQIWTASPLLEQVRKSYFTGLPIPWKRVDVLPGYVYFDHAIHVQKGVGCVECHGRVDRMPEVYKTEPLTMLWCLSCHRDPAPHLRPRRFITSMSWRPPADPGFETWDDARALDGTVSFVQPLIEVLFGGRPAQDVLAMLAGEPDLPPYDRLRRFWSQRLPSLDAARDERFGWDATIQRGFIEESAYPTTVPTTRWEAIAPLLQTPRRPEAAFELSVRPDAKVYDGRFANNPWLQELPEPMTTQTWGNAAWVSPKTAAAYRLETGDHVQVSRGERHLEIPVLVLPGHADGAVTIAAGYGRKPLRNGELNAVDVGANGFLLGDGPVTLEKLGTSERLALTQEHWSMEGRDLALSRTLTEYRRDPRVRGTDEKIFTLYHQPHPPGPQWAMAIDLTSCTGCSACVVACVAENNIPMVGKEQVLHSREMEWLRIDRYFGGKPDRPLVEVQPTLCQQCERAPCEYVCPVNATTHSTDGLNEMTYNRCIGTRFCSNNCPYKVRRFNFFNYNSQVPPSIELSKNPEVTVRARGVMEKCTFCVQRIRTAQIDSQLENRPLVDGDIATACEEACPTRAITFGDMTDEKSRVSQLIGQGRAYQALQEIGTVPRVRYLARCAT